MVIMAGLLNMTHPINMHSFLTVESAISCPSYRVTDICYSHTLIRHIPSVNFMIRIVPQDAQNFFGGFGAHREMKLSVVVITDMISYLYFVN